MLVQSDLFVMEWQTQDKLLHNTDPGLEGGRMTFRWMAARPQLPSRDGSGMLSAIWRARKAPTREGSVVGFFFVTLTICCVFLIREGGLWLEVLALT